MAPTKAPEPKWEENHGIDRFLASRSYTFLAPLSDPIFGSEKILEPKREENHRIDMFLVFKSYNISGTPLGSDFWLRRLRSPNGRKIMESICFWYSNPTHVWRPSRIRFLAGKNSGSQTGFVFWLRESSGAHHGRKKSLQNSIPGTSTLRIPITVATC